MTQTIADSPDTISTPTAAEMRQWFPTPITELKGVGSKLAEKLVKLNIHSVGDMLLHLPLRYQDRTKISPITNLQDKQSAVIEARVLESKVTFGRRRSLVVVLEDNAGQQITLRFFYFNKSQQNRFSTGQWFRCFGEVRRGFDGATMIHPECQSIAAPGANFAAETSLTPIYSLVDGLTQATLRKLSDQALDLLRRQAARGHDSIELLDQSFWQSVGYLSLLPSLAEAIQRIHYPSPDMATALAEFSHPAQHRLVFEELLAEQLSLMHLRDQTRALKAIHIQGDGSLTNALLMSLPFNPTSAQRRVSEEIYADLSSSTPMQRLVQGDVGSGKTLVAALAMLRVIESGQQAVLMAPTEILAEQHMMTLSAWLEPLNIQVDWLTGKRKGKAREQVLADLASGQTQLFIGTHAVFQAHVNFKNLALVVIDEQHRFGVGQRFSLRSKGMSDAGYPHQLIMTATPIPRTLAMTLYADLDVSIIDELPPGRTPIKTVTLSNQRRAEMIERVRKACEQGSQVYWVCSLIEPSEEITAQDALGLHEQLTTALAPIEIGLVHGRMSSADKEQAMQAFKNQATQVLVATTVIEVGVDVPNASIMIIENAERFGLSQLHQLRGRVGRGSVESFCVLLYHQDDSQPLGQIAKSRLQTMRESTSGFDIAQKDLELRGAGEVLGTRQTGDQDLRIANLGRDAHLLPRVQSAANWLRSEQPDTVEALIKRWRAHTLEYGNV